MITTLSRIPKFSLIFVINTIVIVAEKHATLILAHPLFINLLRWSSYQCGRHLWYVKFELLSFVLIWVMLYFRNSKPRQSIKPQKHCSSPNVETVNLVLSLKLVCSQIPVILFQMRPPTQQWLILKETLILEFLGSLCMDFHRFLHLPFRCKIILCRTWTIIYRHQCTHHHTAIHSHPKVLRLCSHTHIPHLRFWCKIILPILYQHRCIHHRPPHLAIRVHSQCRHLKTSTSSWAMAKVASVSIAWAAHSLKLMTWSSQTWILKWLSVIGLTVTHLQIRRNLDAIDVAVCKAQKWTRTWTFISDISQLLSLYHFLIDYFFIPLIPLIFVVPFWYPTFKFLLLQVRL